MKKTLYILSVVLLASFGANAQQQDSTSNADTTIIDAGGAKVIADSVVEGSTTVIAKNDSTRRNEVKKLFEPNPKKAGMYASILPGSGQFYNRQYWKVPIVYAILGTAGFFIKYNYDKYTEYRKAYISRLDATSANDLLPLYQISDIKRLQDSYRKDLDVIVLLTSVAYAAQILDAVASAHLKNFDISPDISMNVQPVIQSNYAGLGLVVNFK